MTHRNILMTIVLAVTFSAACFAQNDFMVISYNVENLFDTRHDTLKNDSAFLPDGYYHWTSQRYKDKLEKLSRVIANMSRWNSPALIGLYEVENEHCVKDLVYGPLKRYRLRYCHYESPDQRGIDCALLYNPKRFTLLESHPIAVPMPASERPTRDILYAKGLMRFAQGSTDTLHVMVCHLPSQLGGTAATAGKRAIAHGVMQATVDSIYRQSPNAKIIIMGDMNATPVDNLKGMKNLMVDMPTDSIGSHKWQGQWSMLDQFYLSPSLEPLCSLPVIFQEPFLLSEDEKFGGKEPFRSYNGPKYIGGFSDHLPIGISIKRVR